MKVTDKRWPELIELSEATVGQVVEASIGMGTPEPVLVTNEAGPETGLITVAVLRSGRLERLEPDRNVSPVVAEMTISC